jgi:4-diphosphocytidyl-2-C-methyl-D-erythritol kinase
MVIFPKAKINLGLRITAKRSDGYHDIETIFYPVNFCDALEFIAAPNGVDHDSIAVTGLNPGGSPDDNLVIKAVRLLRSHYEFPFLKIHLHKAIPAGAGLGGGSSDAAAIMKAVNKYFVLGITDTELRSLALEIGSDCPFFILCQPALARGRGEQLEILKEFLAGYYFVLVNPGIHVSTREAYMNCHPLIPENDLAELVKMPVKSWKDAITNDFEKYVFEKHPLTGEMKQMFYSSGALYSSMSGSGSSIYGLFTDRPFLPEKLRKFVIFEGKI